MQGHLAFLHLPRLWQKVSLEEQGKLAPGYPGIGRGYDAMTCAALGLEEQAVKDYIKQNKPTYPEFEAWVKKNAKSLNRDAIEKHNAAVRGYIHDDETRKGILGACGIADDASAPKDAVNLNNLDDWYEFHSGAVISSLGSRRLHATGTGKKASLQILSQVGARAITALTQTQAAWSILKSHRCTPM